MCFFYVHGMCSCAAQYFYKDPVIRSLFEQMAKYWVPKPTKTKKAEEGQEASASDESAADSPESCSQVLSGEDALDDETLKVALNLGFQVAVPKGPSEASLHTGITEDFAGKLNVSEPVSASTEPKPPMASPSDIVEISDSPVHSPAAKRWKTSGNERHTRIAAILK